MCIWMGGPGIQGKWVVDEEASESKWSESESASDNYFLVSRVCNN